MHHSDFGYELRCSSKSASTRHHEFSDDSTKVMPPFVAKSSSGLGFFRVGEECSDSEEECEEAEVAEVAKVANTIEVSNMNKEEEYFIATVYGGIEAIPEELPENCADPSESR
ncbi:hypothetical protein PIB30_086305 [Stylosanthes scabra]|uniref:Uncharacterized protein n=1 Tax=Stylosanthes scabra TaxID=79078 RepID=A0ABU6ZSE8_9FABA|nr:hypothetical protein [Stylosanthes scabra]